jgi:short subunit dehydrogenase-like uncharacterized protein
VATRIVLFGATGYTGRLTAEAMVARGLRPVLAARSRSKLERLAAQLGGDLELAKADVADPASLPALLERGDVLVSTVGPFVRHGAAAASAAIAAGAHYLDSTGEPPFIREIFERYDAAAVKAECGMLTAFGYDFIPGNLAGALALREAGEAAVRIDTGYFMTGRTEGRPFSGGTMSSLLGVINAPAFAYRDGRLRTERNAARVRSFDVGGRDRAAISVGASDHFGLPRAAPGLREVNAYLGWFGSASRAMQVMSLGGSAAMKLPGASRLWDAATSRLAKGSTGGPDPSQRANAGSHIVAIAYDAEGRPLAEARLTGVDGYTFTGNVLAWGAERAAAGGLRGVGALAPVEAFGLNELREGCAESGLSAEVSGGGRASETSGVTARA